MMRCFHLALAGLLLSGSPAFSQAVQWEKFPNWIETEFQKSGERGVLPFFNYWGVFQGNPVGGNSQTTAYSQEMLFGATFDMEKLAGWQGASFRISGADNAGRNLSETIGNVFTVSQSAVTPTAMFCEMYYKQTLFNNTLEFQIGRLSASDQFCVLPAFGLQVNGGINGTPMSLLLNSNFTNAPNATWAATAKFSPSPDLSVSSGIYQASTRIGQLAYHGLDFSIRPGDGILILSEIGWTPTGTKLAATYKVGGYFSILPAQGFTEQNGFYLIGQQTLWQSPQNAQHTFSLWGGITFSPQYQAAQMPVMGFGGAVWQGLVPGRDQDQFLCTWMTGGFSSAYADSKSQAGQARPRAETLFDFSYICNLTANIFIQPDIQCILQPGGTGPATLVLGAQLGCNF